MILLAIIVAIIGIVVGLTGWGLCLYTHWKWPNDKILWIKLVGIGLFGNLIQFLSYLIHEGI